MRETRSTTTRRSVLRGAGLAASALAAGAASPAAAQEAVEVALVNYAFEGATEDPLYVKPGTTVRFVWETSTHNIVVESQPDGAGWDGYETIEDAGFTYEHTFETKGTYEFFCQPHQSLGMVGTIVVNEDGKAPAGAAAPGSGEGDRPWEPPGGTLGVAFMAVTLGTAGLAAGAVLVGEAYAASGRDECERTNAHTAGVVAALVGVVFLAVVVARLLGVA